jgi:hypothetical protein
MMLRRDYVPGTLNWVLLPGLLQQVMQSIPKTELNDPGNKEFLPQPKFKVFTYSQESDVESEQSFLDFVRASPEPVLGVEISVECMRRPSSLAPYVVVPPFFEFRLSSKLLRIEFNRCDPITARRTITAIEEALQLKPTTPPSVAEKSVSKRRSVFIAHAFDERGRNCAFLLTKLLSLLRFQVVSGEGFSPESVSAKVRRRLSAQGVVVAVLSRAEDQAWLTQEMTAADVLNKPLIVMVQSDVPFKPGILGDIEYIRFPPGQIEAAFVPLLEGLEEIGFEFW